MTVSEHLIHAAITDLTTRFWYDVDYNWGRTAADYYTEDGVFTTSQHRFEGREAIRGFYAWREDRGARAARHIINNMMIDIVDERHVTARWIMSLYAADGEPVLPSHPPIMMADMVDECVLGANGQWQYESRLLRPVFRSATPTTSPDVATAQKFNANAASQTK